MKYFEMAVAVDQHHGFKPFVRPSRCKLQSYSQLDKAMLEFSQANFKHSLKHAFEITNIHRSFSTPCLSHTTSVEEESECNPRIEILGGHRAPWVHALVVEVAIAMTSGVNPEPVSSGLGGAYFLHARNGDRIAVTKPIDEEPLAINNPKGFAGRMLGQPGMKRSIRVGETGFRELAAYLLDHGGFAGVPPTALVKISHVKFHVNTLEPVPPPSKIATLQRFVDHDSDAGDLGPSGFSVSSVHRIGILDVRLLNLDRHSGNILVKHGQDSYAVGAAELVPIDHGLSLPESLDDPYFEWLHWPQASIPFSDSEVDYIYNLDAFKDAELLKAELPSIRESSIRVLVVCTIFLKQATAFGFCLADIGKMMTREFHGEEESWSVLENLCINAKVCLSGGALNDISASDNEGDEIIDEMFHFDSEYEDSSNQVSNVPELVQSPSKIHRPPKIPRFLSERWMSKLHDAELSHVNEEDDCDSSTTTEDSDKDGNNVIDNHKAGTLMKSVSFAVPNYKQDSAAAISFGELSEEEWELFLENFVKLLPEAFESRKNMGLSKQRLGTSCEF
ncbi:unnamed protein product [Ilex paraguariensis]|uniref:1-phosphatidylinositol 4-kinase n=1 Tax=Ilex paraguariensis TaxID=185542 RepID=A0ABC8UIF8_9AQUA